jgi:hypothetical protein
MFSLSIMQAIGFAHWLPQAVDFVVDGCCGSNRKG